VADKGFVVTKERSNNGKYAYVMKGQSHLCRIERGLNGYGERLCGEGVCDTFAFILTKLVPDALS
jgi:hypothetical protein